MSDFIYCRDRELWDTTLSNPRHVLYDLVPQQRQRGGLRDRGHSFILRNVCTERFKNVFYKWTSFSVHLNLFSFLGKRG